MSSEHEDPFAVCVRLLHEAGLGQAEDILRLPPAALYERLAVANRELKLFDEPLDWELLASVQACAERLGHGEVTIADVRIPRIPVEEPASRSYGAELAGEEDFRAWDRRRDVDETDAADLPGKEDFEPWRRG